VAAGIAAVIGPLDPQLGTVAVTKPIAIPIGVQWKEEGLYT
jgi:hypothetical protein